MIRDLISKDANIRAKDRMTRTATEILISRDDVETLKFIHEQRGHYSITIYTIKSFH